MGFIFLVIGILIFLFVAGLPFAFVYGMWKGARQRKKLEAEIAKADRVRACNLGFPNA